MTSVTGTFRGVFGGHLSFLHRFEQYLQAFPHCAANCGLLIVQLHSLDRLHSQLGYVAGDEIRRGFEESLRGILRERDWLFPIHSDRYALVLSPVKNAGHLVLAANRISRLCSECPGLDGAVTLDISIGIAYESEHEPEAGEMLRHAEVAMERARRRFKTYEVYSKQTEQDINSDWDLEREIAVGLTNREFALHFQPKIDTKTLEVGGAEGLMRWDNPRLGPVSPEKFIALCEGSQLIDELTRFAINSAARDAAAWRDAGAELNVSVNLTPGFLEQHTSVVSMFQNAAAIWGIELSMMTAEITENSLVSNVETVTRNLEKLRDAGVRVSIDDFGTGFSSLSYFKVLPADELKIDKSFVLGMRKNRSDRRLVSAIIDLAHKFDLQVVAEGVEDEETVRELQAMDCDELQGYYFAKPMAQGAFTDYLRNAGRLGDAVRSVAAE